MQREKGKRNDGLKKYNDDKKVNTINKVREAIIILQEERSVITPKKLMEITGFCGATFCSDHVEELLKEYKVCKYKDSRRISDDNPKSYLKNLEKEYDRLVKDNGKLSNELSKSRGTNNYLISDLSKKQNLINLYLGKIDELQGIIINKSPTLIK
ncbi:MAG: hypothetical protein ACREV6_02145 [Clostridium sp.]|uniref:hypothetical protein n=1 Tax=Clostridium sp. TaxID=1506 RepID=UPI003D6D1D97